MLYFVVRIDVVAGDGKQRVFGCHDDLTSASNQIADLQGHMRGEFRVFAGREVAA